MIKLFQIMKKKLTPINNDPQIAESVDFNSGAMFSSITWDDNDILKIIIIITLARPMVLMIYQSEWSSYVMMPLLNLYKKYSRTVIILVSFLIVGKTLSQFLPICSKIFKEIIFNLIF